MTGLPRDRKAMLNLLRAVENIIAITDLDALLEEVLDISVDILEADRGMIFLRRADGAGLDFHFGRNVDHNSIDEAREYSTRLVEQAESHELIVVEDVRGQPGFSAFESILRYDIRAVMCAPLRIGNETRGVIYLDSRNRSLEVDETRRALLSSFASLAAQVIETSRAHRATQAERDQLSTENLELKERAQQAGGAIVGECPAIQSLLHTIAKVAPGPSNVLIEGESGTGKELVARAIHGQSRRATGPFVAVSCPSVPRELIESEFFGHERGAFTGATERRLGKFELANQGTLFLDEVGDMDLPTQTKLLRAIQERSFSRVGGARTIEVDVRILAATSRDLSARVAAGEFREDLYYRLCVVPVRVPALRERQEDVPHLVGHFISRFNRIFGRCVEEIESTAMETLRAAEWPGNVRQLENAIEYAMNVASGRSIRREDLPGFLVTESSSPVAPITPASQENFDETIARIEGRLISDALARAQGNQSEAARSLGLTESRIRAKIRKYRIP